MNKRIVNISLILLLGSTGSVLAQQGIGTNRPHKSAAVEIESTNKGLLIPRMELKWEDEKIVAPTIDSPAPGLLVFNNKNTAAVPEGFYYFSNALWNPIGVSELDSSTTTTITGNGTATNPYKIEVKDLKGDVTGSILTNKVEKIQGIPVSSNTPTNGQVLKIDSGIWTPSTLKGSDISDPKNLTANGPLHVDSGTGAVLKDVTLRVDTATKNSLGVVQIGEGINVDNGVISVPAAPGETITHINYDSSTNVTHINEDTSTVVFNLGDEVRKNQNNTFVTGSTPITIDSSTVDKNTTYNVSVDTATASTLGVVKPGTGLTIDSGTLHVDTLETGIGKNLTTDGLILVNDSTTLQNSVLANTSLKIKEGNEGQVLTTVANKPKWVDPTADKVTTLTGVNPTGNAIGTYKNEAGTDAVIKETITKITYDSSTNLTYLGEDTSTVVFNLGDEVRKNQKTTTVVGNGAITVNPTSPNAIGDTAYTVSVDTATATTLGVVKPGTGLTIDNGTLNVDTSETGIGKNLTTDGLILVNDSTTVENTVLANTSLKIKGGTNGQVLKTVGDQPQWVTPAVDSNTTNVSLKLDTETNNLTLLDSDSKTVVANLAAYKNKVYTLASDSNTISLLADGTLADSETVVKTVALDLSTEKKLTATVNGVSNAIALDLSVLNTDSQHLTYHADSYTLEISGDSRTINLSGLVTKLDTGTNTTLVGNGTIANPYKVSVATANMNTLGVVKQGLNTTIVDGAVNVATANTTSLGVVRQATDSPTVNVTNGELAVNLTNTVLSGEVKGPLNSTIIEDNVIDTANLMDSAVATTKIKPAVIDSEVSKVLITNKDGVVEWSTSARPDFFYYPSILIPLSGNNSTNTSYPSSAGYLELDLYTNYSQKWTTPAASSEGAESTSLSSILIPENMIDIYVTYFDDTVIKSGPADGIKIDGGKMYYKVHTAPTVTAASYMNIVFKVRKTPRQ